MLKRVQIVLLISAAFVTSLTAFYSSRHIASFESVIVVNRDGSMDVQEKIIYFLPSGITKYGINRDFPTRYQDTWGNKFNVGFAIKEIIKDGTPIQYNIIDLMNGKRIKIGDAHKALRFGEHIYGLKYHTNRQLYFAKKNEQYDELYWNVTGNGWTLPIASVRATVTLPIGIKAHDIQVKAYTGLQGEKGAEYKASVTPDGQVIVSTTKPLAPSEGLTIAVRWPTGFIQKPTMFDKVKSFLVDNLGILWIVTGFLLLFFYCLKIFLRQQKSNSQQVIIPLFKPPHNLLPGAVRFIDRMGFDNKVFASEIVNMAVHNILVIEYKSGWFKKSYYLIKNKEQPAHISKEHELLRDTLFASTDRVDLSNNQVSISKTANRLQALYKRLFADKYFYFNTEGFIFALLIAFFTLMMPIALPFLEISSLIVYSFFVIPIIILLIILYRQLTTYTREGQKIANEIKGFELFLKTTETERLKLIGSPPTKSPELYEKYLPYAIALGAEEQWSKQFAPLFAQWKQEGHVYAPTWYQGPGSFSYVNFNVPAFSAQLSNSLNTFISASTSIPGSTSGYSGGSSGGGGGGGGGSDW